MDLQSADPEGEHEEKSDRIIEFPIPRDHGRAGELGLVGGTYSLAIIVLFQGKVCALHVDQVADPHHQYATQQLLLQHIRARRQIDKDHA